MKTFLRILFFFFLVTQICLGQWYQQNSGTTDVLYSIRFINDTVGWAAGGYWSNRGTILKTSDGGMSWVQQPTGVLYELLDIYMINENKGWAVGDGGVIIATTDGGTNWTQQQQPFGTNCLLNSVYFLNENLGWTVGGGGAVILKTTDGGMNWIAQTADTNLSFIITLRDVYIINENVGWIVGSNDDTIDPQGILLKTTNGGATWTNIDFGGDGSIFGIQFINQNIGCFSFKSNYGLLGWTNLYMTTNGGENWAFYSLMGIPSRGFPLSFHFINEDLGWAVDGYYDALYGGFIFKTTDGGGNWDVYPSGTIDIGLRSIFFIDSSCGWVVGDMGTILHTTNGGVTFVEEEVNEIPTEFLLSQNFPNPFNPSTQIKYSIPQSSQVVIKVFDILGNEIETLVNEEKPAGTYELSWNAANLPSGVYFYRLQAGEFNSVRKMILLK